MLGGLPPAAALVVWARSTDGRRWPATPHGWFFEITALTAYLLTLCFIAASYFLVVLLLLGRSRAALERRPCLMAGAAAGVAVVLLASVAAWETLFVMGSALSACAGLTLILAQPVRSRPAHAKTERRESLGTRRGSQPFAFGIVTSVGLVLWGAIVDSTPPDEGMGRGFGVAMFPYMSAFLAIPIGALFALGAGLASLVRRRAAASHPYGLCAGAAVLFISGLLSGAVEHRPPLVMLLCICAGLIGTLTGHQEPAPLRRSAKKGPQRA